MRKEIIETGKTVDAAIDSACEKLGCERDACDWEIIDLPKKAFLGLKTIPAKVKVSVEVPEEKAAKRKPAPKQVQKVEPRQEQKVGQNRPPQPKPAQKPVEPQKREPRKQEPGPVERLDEKQPAPVLQEHEEDFLAPNPRTLVTGEYTEKEKAAMAYITAILGEFGLSGTLQVFREGNGIYLDITGDGLGTIIGRRGETLDAIQYLTGLVANRMEGEYLRVTVDCGNYRTKRKETLEALAKKLAAQVLKTNISKTLEPMNPFERRVIHATVSKIDGVSSSSIGEEPNRRVVITSPTARRSSPRGGYGRSGGKDSERRPRSGGRERPGEGRSRHGDDRRRPGGRGPRPAQPQAPAGPPKETAEAAVMSDAPIGKLDLE